MEEREALTIRETARAYRFPEFTLRCLVKQGKFPVIQTGAKVWILRHVFEDFIKKGGEVYDPHYSTRK
jgi:hypothetical protein